MFKRMISIRIVISHSTSYRDQRFFFLSLRFLLFCFTRKNDILAQSNSPNEFQRITECAVRLPNYFLSFSVSEPRSTAVRPIQSKYFTYFIYLFIYDDECQQFYHFFFFELFHLIRVH